MFYIIGSEEQRKEFVEENFIPYFDYEEIFDVDAVRLWNREDEAATLYINLIDSNEPVYTFEFDGHTFDFHYYENALDAYETAEEEAEKASMSEFDSISAAAAEFFYYVEGLKG